MENLFTYCAVIGGVLFVGQMVLMLIGIGGEHADFDIGGIDIDIDIDVPDGDMEYDGGGHFDVLGHNDSLFVGILTVKSLIAAVTVFGFAGKWALDKGFSEVYTALIATVAGGAILYLVGWVFKELYKIRTDGTVKIQNTIGCSGEVYLPVPSGKESVGKVTISVAGRTMEYTAMTAGKELPSGTPITVVAVLGPDMVEVEGVNETVETAVPSTT